MESEDVAGYPLPLLVDVLNRVLPDAIDRALAEAGYRDVSRACGAVFEAMDPGGSRVTDMAARARVSKQAMAELCAGLESRGYVERRPDPTDGRAKLVALTPRGEAMVAVAQGALAGVEAAWRARLGAADTAELRRLLSGLVAGFAAEHIR